MPEGLLICSQGAIAVNGFVISFNNAVNLAGLLLSVFGLFYVLSGARVDRHLDRFFILASADLLLFGTATACRQMMSGVSGDSVRTLLLVACYLEFLSSFLLLYVASRYLLFITDLHRSSLRYMLFGILILHVLLLTFSQFTGLFYTVETGNVYKRGPGYLLCYVPTAAGILLDVGVLLFYRERLRRREYLAFWAYLSIPAVSILLQILIPGISFGVLASMIALFCLFLMIVSDRKEQFYRHAQENASLKIDILLAQIQPHFLFNAISTIRSLSYSDPELTRKGLDKLSDYLRHNMDSLTEDRPILFREERKHVESYLELQRLRFGEDLRVEFDLECESFFLPTLTLQPIVENAIRYGVRKNERGSGAVIIRSRDFPDHVELSVTDDGPGFVPDSIPGDSERSHVGLKNVRERLKRISGGELRVDSVIGKGTTVTMILPKKQTVLP